MKKTISILYSLFISFTFFAQVPQKMSYQAIIRDANNSLVVNQKVGMKISILQGSVTGTEVYSELQTPSTNANGLISIQFGGGEGFSTIDWSLSSYYIQTETDITGGSNYTITGSSQLLSVPYALYAAKSGGNTFNFAFTGIKDISTTTDSVVSMPIELIWVDGEQEAVTLTATGLPYGCTINFSKNNLVANFNTIATVSTNNNTATGIYPIQIVGTSINGKIKKYPFTITVNSKHPTTIYAARKLGFQLSPFASYFNAFNGETIVSSLIQNQGTIVTFSAAALYFNYVPYLVSPAVRVENGLTRTSIDKEHCYFKQSTLTFQTVRNICLHRFSRSTELY